MVIVVFVAVDSTGMSPVPTSVGSATRSLSSRFVRLLSSRRSFHGVPSQPGAAATVIHATGPANSRQSATTHDR